MDLQEYQAVVGSTSAEFAATGLSIGQLFPWQIIKQNEMYSLPVNEYPTLDGLGESPFKRMNGFLKTLQKEMDEGREIHFAMHVLEQVQADNAWWQNATEDTLSKLAFNTYVSEETGHPRKVVQNLMAWVNDESRGETEAIRLERYILVSLADWLGDMNVYNRSEALKYGIPLEGVLACIMGSNFTKLGEDGQPIKDENGKIVKGPNFQPPEEHIYATLFGTEELNEEYAALTAYTEEVKAISGAVLEDPMAEIFEAKAAAETADVDFGEEEEEDDPDYEQQ